MLKSEWNFSDAHKFQFHTWYTLFTTSDDVGDDQVSSFSGSGEHEVTDVINDRAIDVARKSVGHATEDAREVEDGLSGVFRIRSVPLVRLEETIGKANSSLRGVSESTRLLKEENCNTYEGAVLSRLIKVGQVARNGSVTITESTSVCRKLGSTTSQIEIARRTKVYRSRCQYLA